MILVTGATGLVGTHLLIHLAKEQQPIRALYRTEAKKETTKKLFFEELTQGEAYTSTEIEALFLRIQWIQTTLEDIEGLHEAFQNVQIVYHCAALISYDPAAYKALRKTNIEGTANVVNLCIQHQVQKLCYVSSIATLGPPIHSDLSVDETTEWNPEALNSNYAITKYGAELEVWRGSQEGLNVVIVNPGVIIGTGAYQGGSGVIFSKIYRGQPFYTTGSTGFVSVNDVIKAMVQLTKSTINNERYVLVGENLSYKDALTKIALALHKKPPQTKASATMLQGFRILKWCASLLPGIRSDFSKAIAAALLTNVTYDTTKIKTALAFEFEPMDITIQKAAAHFLKTKK